MSHVLLLILLISSNQTLISWGVKLTVKSVLMFCQGVTMVKCFAKGGAGDNRNLRLCANYLFICLLCLWATIVLVLTTVGGLMSKYLKLFQRCQQLCSTNSYSRNILNYSKGVSSMFSLSEGSVLGVWIPRTGHPGSDLTWKCESNIHIMS